MTKVWSLKEPGRISFEDREERSLSSGEVRLRVEAAGICGSDIARIYKTGAHRMPIVPGHEFSGTVEAVGSDVSEAWLGKRAGVFPMMPCGECEQCKAGRIQLCRNYNYLGSRSDGGFARYANVPAKNLMELPEKVSFEQAAMLEPLSVAVHAMRAATDFGQGRVIVIGLGTIGMLLTMLLREKGLDHVLVYGKYPWQLRIAEEYGAVPLRENALENADVVFECVGKEETLQTAVAAAAPRGQIVTVGNPASDMTLPKELYWKILRNELTIKGTWNSLFTHSSEDDWAYALNRLGEGRINPERVITHRLPLSELEKGLGFMMKKTEPCIKVMLFPGDDG